MRTRHPAAIVAAAVVIGAAAAVFAQRDFSKVEITTETLAPGVYVLKGAGGNIGVCAGPDGVFLVDGQYAPLTEKIRAAVAAVSDKPIRFVLNTHWHGDHTGGNENFGKAGALLMAHYNVRQRMSTEQYSAEFAHKTDPSPAGALPAVTFSDSLTVHLNGEELAVVHVANAHTDGDAIVWFRKADVVHMGDTFFNGLYPRIDLSAGGSADGMIAAVESVLQRVGPQTKIVPGHGPVGDRAALVAYRDMLVGAREAVRKAAAGGKSLAEVQAAKPTAAWDATLGNSFIKPDKFVEFLYAGVTQPKP